MSETPLLPYVTFPAKSPRLPMRRPDDGGLPTYVVRATLAELATQATSFAGPTQIGQTLNIRVEIVAPGVAPRPVGGGRPARIRGQRR